MNLDKIPNRQKAILLGKRIKPYFPTSGEGLLMFAILDQAITDLFTPEVEVPEIHGDETKRQLKTICTLQTKSDARERDRLTAITFLKGDIFPAALCGVEPEWIRSSIKKIGYNLG